MEDNFLRFCVLVNILQWLCIVNIVRQLLKFDGTLFKLYFKQAFKKYKNLRIDSLTELKSPRVTPSLALLAPVPK